MIDNYNALSLGKYVDICDICADSTQDELQKQVAILAILADKTEDEVLTLPILEYKQMAKDLKFLETLPTISGRRIGGKYKVAGQEYKPVTAIGRMTTAQYIDFQGYSTDVLHHLPELCSIFLVPVGKTYNTDYDIVEVQGLFRDNLSVAEANDLIAFFLRKFNDSIKGMLIFSRWEARRKRNKSRRVEMMARIAQAETDLRQSGDGLRMLMQLQRPADAIGTRSGR